MISSEREAEILRLHHAEKWPVGTIATQLGVHHTVVRRVLGQAGISRHRVMSRPSIADPYMPYMLEVLTKYPRLSASRLYQMVHERGYRGAVDHFRHIVASVRPRPAAEAFLRLRTLPGEQGQVDWAHFGKVTIGRATRRLWAFVIVLSWSRAIFLRFYLSAAMPSFLRGLWTRSASSAVCRVYCSTTISRAPCWSASDRLSASIPRWLSSPLTTTTSLDP